MRGRPRAQSVLLSLAGLAVVGLNLWFGIPLIIGAIAEGESEAAVALKGVGMALIMLLGGLLVINPILPHFRRRNDDDRRH